MTGQIVLGLIIGLPLLLGILFRVSTSHIFFSLMAGELLGRYFGHDVEKQANAVSNQVNITGYGEIALLTVPMLLTAVFLRRSISKGKILLHIVPLLITGVVYAAFLIPILPVRAQQEIQTFIVGGWLLHLNKVIIGGMVIVQLVSLWALNRGENAHKNKHH